MYNQKVISRFANPANAGGLQKSNGTAKLVDEITGDTIKLYFKINPENDVIEEAQFKTCGCVASIACSDIVCDMVRGKSIEEANIISNQDIVNALGGLPENKLICAITVEDAIKEAISKYIKTKEIEEEME